MQAIELKKLVEVRFHGRGGQGVVTAARLLAEACLLENKYSLSFPEFGPERSGAPVRAYVRISDEPIEVRSLVYDPEIVVSIDPKLSSSVEILAGLDDEGVVIINSKNVEEALLKAISSKPRAKLFYVDARGIALSLGDARFENSAILGAFAKATGIVSLSSLESVLRTRFKGAVLENNLKAMRLGYDKVGQA
ncbi:MAG: 2-oxoacid:acceptor oxidoreductase family protein [Nitrososphaerota archaeon]